MTIFPYADATMTKQTDDQDWAWIALSAAIRNVVTFIELAAAAPRGNRDATAWLPEAGSTSGTEKVRELTTLHGTNASAYADPSETAGDLSESRRSRSPTRKPSDGLKNELLPTASVLWEGGGKPPAAYSALEGAAELERDNVAPAEIILRQPSATA